MSSFISNFRKRRRLYNFGLIGLIVLFGIAENRVFRNLDFYGMQPYSFVGQLSELEHSFELMEPERIMAAVFGDSQSIDALRPDLMEEAAGREAGTMFNFSISGGKAYDIYHTYLQYAKQLPSLRDAIIVVNEHQLNSSGIDQDTKFRYYAGFGDRLRVMNMNNYGELLLGWVSKAYDMRSVWAPMLDKYFEDDLPDPVKWKLGGIRARTAKAPLTAQNAEDTATRWFENYQLDGLQTDSLEDLLRDLHERGVRTTLLQIPRSSLFETAVTKLFPKEQQRYFATIEDLARRYEAEFVVMSNEGLPDDQYFRDTNHLNAKGAAIVSKDVAERWLGK
ncbi:SGNH/GDSL hydrolase family protein [Cohnella panacarvi]|uniref:SGNH/GDSL hydrolase family protein n=1 Tax=Cohnella panacarvi TaxID=400776 RepID=UPI0004AEFB8E|nr:SGNH/GDSL hydrolase family protein [Cohnella panacarvi]